MIIRNNKVISALYKGTKEILRRYKGIQLIYEAFKKLFASGSLPLVLRNCRGNDYILPEKYVELSCIEADSNAYIDTGFYPDSNTSIEIEALIKTGDPTVSKNNFIFGATESEDHNNRFAYNLFYSSYSYTFGAYPRFSINAPTMLKELEMDKWYKYKVKNGKFYVNNEMIAEYTETFEKTSFSLYLNAYNAYGTVESTYIGNSKIGKCKIWDGDVLARNFIPCYCKEDNSVGLYDLVENKFYTSATAYSFKKGFTKGTLPEEYQKVEYIEANGTQYIDMQYAYKINDEINISFMKTQDTPNVIQGVFGNGNLAPYTGTVLYINGTNILTSTIGGTLGQHFFKYEAEPIQNDKIYNVKYETNKVYVNNNHVMTSTYSVVDGTQSDFSLFRRWGTNGFYGRIYSFSIIRDGKAIFNMVPCYRKSDGVIGMYDLSFGVFYQNSGTGEFIKGADKIAHIENPSVINYQIYGNSIGSGTLPAEFQHVEYIESTGTQHIDTEVPLREGLKMIVDWVYNDADSGNSYVGAHIGSPGQRWLVGSQRQGSRYYFAVSGINFPTEFKFGNRDIVEAYWKSNESYIKINGVESTLNNWRDYPYSNASIALDYTFYLGATNRDGNGTLKPKLKIYGCKFYQDDILVRNYVPCYNTIDGKIGLYDLVESKFYTNAGTGEFLKGNDFINSGSGIELQGVGDKTKNIANIDTGLDKQLTKNNDGTYKLEYNTEHISGDIEANLEAEKTYTISADIIESTANFTTSTGEYCISFYSTGGETVATHYQGSLKVSEAGTKATLTFTSKDNYKSIRMYIHNSYVDVGSYVIFKNFQIEEGSTPTDYEPFGYRIPITHMNNNFLNIAACENGTIHNTAGTDHSQPNRVRTGYIYLNKGKYCISTKDNELNIKVGSNAHVYSQPDDAFWLAKIVLSEEFSTESRTYRVIDAPMDGYYRFIFLPVGFDDSSKILDITNFYQFEPQVELGVESIGFITWREPKTINNYISQPLFYLSQDFCDYTDFQKQKLIQNVGVYTFNGTEEIELYKEIQGGSVFRIDNFVSPKIGAPMTATAMTHFSVTSIYSTVDFYPGLYRFVSSNPVQNIENTGLYISSTHATVEEFKEWLSINKPKLYYPLDMPIEKDVNLLNIDLQNGDNIIDIKTTAKPDKIEIEYKGKE